MTVIAFRHGVMACDSCWTYGDTQVASAIKIKRLTSGALLGAAGDNDARAIEDLLDKIKSPDKLPSREALAASKVDFIGLLAFPRGGVWVVSSGPVDEAGWPKLDSYDQPLGENGVWPATTMGGFAAVGSGSDYALAAFHSHQSVTAERAVEVACRLNINCRLPVHKLALWLPSGPGRKAPRRSK